MARLEHMEPRMTNIHIELDSQLITFTQLKGRKANLTTQILDMAEGARDPTNGKRATQRTSLTADLVEIHDTKMIRPITTSHPLAETHHIVTFLKSFCESELINPADHEVEYERGRMLDTLTRMFMHRFNVKGSEVPLDFNTISIIKDALGLLCKRAVDLVSGMETGGVATNMQATRVIAKMTYSPDHVDEYEGLTWASAKDLAKTLVVRFALIMGKRLTRNLKIQSHAKAAAPHYEAGEGSGGPKPTVPPKVTDANSGTVKDKRYDLWPTGELATTKNKTAWCARNMCEAAMTGTCTWHVSKCNFLYQLGLDKDNVLTMIKTRRAARAKR
eukprot:jgi/Tetstr1/456229/TSEL_042992.t1